MSKPESFTATLMSGIDIECYDADDYETLEKHIAQLEAEVKAANDEAKGILAHNQKLYAEVERLEKMELYCPHCGWVYHEAIAVQEVE